MPVKAVEIRKLPWPHFATSVTVGEELNYDIGKTNRDVFVQFYVGTNSILPEFPFIKQLLRKMTDGSKPREEIYRTEDLRTTMIRGQPRERSDVRPCGRFAEDDTPCEDLSFSSLSSVSKV